MKITNSDVDFHNFQMDTITVALVEDKCFIWKIKRNKFPHLSVLRIKAVQGCPLQVPTQQTSWQYYQLHDSLNASWFNTLNLWISGVRQRTLTAYGTRKHTLTASLFQEDLSVPYHNLQVMRSLHRMINSI